MKKIIYTFVLLFAANFIFTSCRCIEIELFATSITLNSSELVLTVGQTETLIATVLPENAVNRAVTWKSGDESIAVVADDGTVTAVSLGATIVTVTTTDGELTAVATVTVVPTPVTGVTLNRNTLMLDVGETETLIATVIPIDATNQAVTWSSSNASVAVVSNSGVVTALSEGTAVITVTTVDGSHTAICNVIVYDISTLDGIVINGIRWATRNVDMPGTFAPAPESFGMFYQWNRQVGWSSTDPMVNSDGGTTWNSSNAIGTSWTSANDPCPAGWRVPIHAELQSLINAGSIWTTRNGVSGHLFGTAPYQIFLPDAGFRYGSTGTLFYSTETIGGYWSSTWYSDFFEVAQTLWLSSGSVSVGNRQLSYGLSVRCVAE